MSRRYVSFPVLACLVTALGGCFETGPLFSGGTGAPGRDSAGEVGVDAPSDADSDDGGASEVGPVEVGDTPDVAVAPDSRDASDALGDSAVGAVDVADTGDTAGPAETAADSTASELPDTAADVNAGSLRACLVDGDCDGVVVGDRCAGPVRCIDYGCRQDPAGSVVCATEAPCTASECNPATGLCEERNTCSCETPLALPCAVPLSWSSNDPGGRDPYAAFGCGPAPAGPSMRLVSLAPSGRVRVTGNEGVAGLHVLEGACDPTTSCEAGGERVLYFDALPGATYTLAVEERGPSELVTVRADCGLTRESACRDGLDDDADGLSDCGDRDCDGIDGCALPPLDEGGLCGDEVDNDEDGATDCDDPDCAGDVACLETCEVLTGSTYCNYKQGLTNGGGKMRSTHYSCNPVPQTAKEVVFEITAGYSGPIRIAFQGSNGLALHLLVDTGRGCTPRDCVQMSTTDITFDMVLGTTYYLAIDGPSAVVGNFNIEIDCLE